MALGKITVALPKDLVRYASERAARSGKSRSQVIAEALAAERAREVEMLAAEGYRYYADEAEEFAEASRQPTAEALGDDR